jgi:hypothetical protein
MENIRFYIDELSTALQSLKEPVNFEQVNGSIINSLNGEPYHIVRKNLDSGLKSNLGIFFTSQYLSSKLIKKSGFDKNKYFSVFDPGCGAGDLLLECAKLFPVRSTLLETLTEWGSRLFAYDILEDFVALAKIRLTFLAIARGVEIDGSVREIDNLFPNIKHADFLNEKTDLPKTDLVLLNPPYSTVKTYSSCSWSSGKVTQAALFMEKVMTSCLAGTKICAILPDVLRSGTRYLKWREYIAKNSVDLECEIIGKFDKYTDVDVFFYYLTKSICSKNTTVSKVGITNSKKQILLSDIFDIHVGTVVPHRDKEEGREYKYLTAKDLNQVNSDGFSYPLKKTISATFSPPFVVVKRTSSPSDKPRAKATMILGESSIALENHLIVLLPKDGSTESCLKLVKLLHSSETDKLLNERIRCRHLTVSSLGGIQWMMEQS